MSRYKNLYDTMLESGELKELYRGMTGDWTKDEKKFIQEQQMLESLAGAVDIDEEYE